MSLPDQLQASPPRVPSVVRDGDFLVLPGMATVHSHAFQRALRGRTQRRSTAAQSFWSWRGLMFSLADRLTPDDLLNIARFAFVELAMSGVTAVGEFHYLHHDRGGQPYANRIELAEVMIQAAREAGIRITLIRAAYLRAGYGQEVMPGQDRFCDQSIDQVLADVDLLRARHANDPLVRVGLAAHSIRAVPLNDVCTLVAYARAAGLPFHMHLAEQRRELAECQGEYGRLPVELLADHGLLHADFTAIHATHLTRDEMAQLGAARCFVGICRTTERDLGDGFPETSPLLGSGARLCVGVDSYASSDAFEELRALELDARPCAELRHVVADAPALLAAATSVGYASIGMRDDWQADAVWLAADDPALAATPDTLLPDAVVFAATPRAVRRVSVAGRVIVEAGLHLQYDVALDRFRQTMRGLDERIS